MEINTNPFLGEISNASGFNEFMGLAYNSPALAALINSFATASGTVSVGDAGSYTASTKSIVLDRRELPVSGDANSQLNFAGLLAHELGHAASADGLLSREQFTGYLNAPNAEAAAMIQLRQEGAATYAEYLVSNELGTTLRAGDKVKASLDVLATWYERDINGFREAAINLAADAYKTVNPSTAPNVTYQEMYGDAWYAYKAGLAPRGFDWQNFYSNDIVASEPGGGIIRVTTSNPLSDGVRTSTFSIDLNYGGDVLKSFVASTTYDGFRYAQVSGEGVYYLNDTVVTARQSDSNSLYASVIGNGNDIYVFDGNEIRLAGSDNYLYSQNSDALSVSGEHNTLDINGAIDSIVVNDVEVPNYLDGISYVGDTAIGFGGADVGFGTNFPDKGYEVPEAPQQNRGTTLPFFLPAPGLSEVVRVVGAKDAIFDEVVMI
ncbi:hypothetical protein [Pseudoduganella chitinolytica]|uniref:Hemolysin n=1 Tax=Pseudoduganella chitinolytica TaxID=34070 RepID=A0ABY8BA44_9BURK|nr:hypothetical protein [Pseudoduganella chitinolytica]WEF31224.1 hypothetical protein PX653_17350 [Pseudoduganella chitinolytica]